MRLAGRDRRGGAVPLVLRGAFHRLRLAFDTAGGDAGRGDPADRAPEEASMSPSDHPQRWVRRGATPPGLHAVAALLLLLLAAPGARAQDSPWTGRLFLQARSVEDREAWLVLRQQAAKSFSGGGMLQVGLTQTRRFGDWDASVGASGTLRPGGGAYLSLDARITPEADVIDDARFGARMSLPLGELVPSVGYRIKLFGDDPVHAVSPRLNWYRGSWLLSGEVRLVRSALETTSIAAIGRVTRRIPGGWSVRIGVARGEEDFRVGRPPGQSLRTLTSRSLSAGVERRLTDGWTVQLDLAGVDTDQGLDRFGASVTLARTF